MVPLLCRVIGACPVTTDCIVAMTQCENSSISKYRSFDIWYRTPTYIYVVYTGIISIYICVIADLVLQALLRSSVG